MENHLRTGPGGTVGIVGTIGTIGIVPTVSSVPYPVKPAFALQDSPDILTQLAQFFSARLPASPPHSRRRSGENQAFLAGGFLRDALLYGDAAASHDLDIAVPVLGPPLQELSRELAHFLGGSCVPHSLAHGVFQVILPPTAPAVPRTVIDLAGFRPEDDIKDDLARRDFTVNAMALPLNHPALRQPQTDGVMPPSVEWAEDVIDPFGGKGDLARRQLRAVNPTVFRYDPGRLLRAVRLAGQLNFRLEPATAAQIRADAAAVERVAPERVRNELMLILAADGARARLEVLDRLDLLCRVIPELAETRGVDQPRAHHYWDVWNHLLHTVEYAEMVTRGHQHSAIYSLAPWTPAAAEHFAGPAGDGHSRRTFLKLAGLLHDIAKPQTKQVDAAGRTRFFGHSELGAEMVESRMAQLRFSGQGTALVSRMIRYHLRPAQLRQGAETPSRRAIYRYFRELEDAAVDTIYLALADYLAAKGPEVSAEQWAGHARMLAYVLQTGTEQAPVDAAGQPRPRLLTGNDLMEYFDLPPGRQIGRLLERIDEARAAGEVATREEALALAAGLLEKV